VAYSGSSGLEAAQTFEPDAIICDLAMPGLDGYAVARRLRRDPCHQQVFLIAMTGYASAEDCRASRAAGFNLHFTKPAEPEVLVRVLHNYGRCLMRDQERHVLQACG
jgi:CheY-like chemotaxis protein